MRYGIFVDGNKLDTFDTVRPLTDYERGLRASKFKKENKIKVSNVLVLPQEVE